MKMLLRTVLVGIVSAVALAPVAGATSKVSSGDTCIASGYGKAYSVAITLPSNASDQAGFAFGVPGAAVKIVNVQGMTQMSGSASTQGLPANTSAAWLMDAPGVPPGNSITATLALSKIAAGSFTVVPANSSHSTYFDPIVCQMMKTQPVSTKFTVVSHVSYAATLGVWHLTVVIPGAGVVSAAENEPTVGTQSPEQQTAKSLVQVRKRTMKMGGRVTLSLRPTAAGLVKLRTNGSITVKLNIAFAPTSGQTATRVVRLTLRK